MNVSTIAVVGAGTMGRGIIESAAVHNLDVNVFEISDEQSRSALGKIEQSMDKAVQRGKIERKTAAEAVARVRWHSDLKAAAGPAQFVIEAVPEDEHLKRTLFGELDAICESGVILASNTSSVSITRLAAATSRPERVLGMHFFNPVPVMPPVEIVKGLATSEQTLNAAVRLAERLGKRAFVVEDTPGFAVNRVLLPLINEAVFALSEGVADAETIDSLMKLGCNHPMGPLELADFVGLDVCLSILRVLHRELGDPKFRPCPLLVRMVDAGRLGRKSGRGFYEY